MIKSCNKSQKVVFPQDGPIKIPYNEKLAKLSLTFPAATDEEHRRFLNAKQGNLELAEKQLGSYLEWRKSNHLDDGTINVDAHRDSSLSEDENDWNCAALTALSLEKGFTTDLASFPRLPRLARMDDVEGNSEMIDRDGRRILQVNPAMLDINLASEETYAFCIALYLDRRLSRTSMEKVILCVDVRGGHGWKNPPAKKMIPFVRQMVSVLEANFPERLQMSIVYPLNWTACALWKIVKIFLDPNTAEKVAVIEGACRRDSEIPYDKMQKYIDRDVLRMMEKNRISAMKPRRH